MKSEHFILLISLLFFFSCRSRTFVYQNPITDGIDEGGLRDCQIVRDCGRWYMTGTCAPVHVGANPGVSLYSSSDLKHWKFENYLIEREKLDSSVWYYDRVLAPEIHKIKNKNYLLFNSKKETKSYTHGRGTCVAVSKKITGPYTVLTEDQEFSGGIDLNFFEDTDGKVYANWHDSIFIYSAEVDMEIMKPKNIYVALSPDSCGWDSAGIEGSFVIKHNGTYYMFYSSWTRGYEIGYATSKSPNGPWKKYESNPIYGGQDEARCMKYGGIYSGNPEDPFGQVGHCNIFKGPDNGYWLSCHGILKGGKPMLVIEPFTFDNGRINIGKPTTNINKITW